MGLKFDEFDALGNDDDQMIFLMTLRADQILEFIPAVQIRFLYLPAPYLETY
jgi:hypothetical protein